jgi:hypothetical protein
VKPLRIQVIDNPVSAVLERGVELRVQPSLWALRDAVIQSTLMFSIIRWRNAAPQQVNATEPAEPAYVTGTSEEPK